MLKIVVDSSGLLYDFCDTVSGVIESVGEDLRLSSIVAGVRVGDRVRNRVVS